MSILLSFSLCQEAADKFLSRTNGLFLGSFRFLFKSDKILYLQKKKL